MIHTTTWPFLTWSIVSKTALGLRPLGSGWFEQVLRTPSNRGGTHGPGSACVVTEWFINTTMRLPSQEVICECFIVEIRAYAWAAFTEGHRAARAHTVLR
jgi:hypothetical protein